MKTGKMWYGKLIWRDWRSSQTLRICSLAARGLWIELHCIAAEFQGPIMLTGRTSPMHQLGRLLGIDPRTLRPLIDELSDQNLVRLTLESAVFADTIKVVSSDNQARNTVSGVLEPIEIIQNRVRASRARVRVYSLESKNPPPRPPPPQAGGGDLKKSSLKARRPTQAELLLAVQGGRHAAAG
jgi:hypothetical protein